MGFTNEETTKGGGLSLQPGAMVLITALLPLTTRTTRQRKKGCVMSAQPCGEENGLMQASLPNSGKPLEIVHVSTTPLP